MSADRARRRALWAFSAVQTWRAHHGVPQLEHLLLAAFGAQAEARGLWAFLHAKGMITDEEHEDYLDKGWQSFMDQMSGAAQKIFVTEGGNG